MKTLNELFNDPYYWSNNKRRVHGLKPIRKNKERIRKIAHSVDLFNAIESEIENQIQANLNSYFDNFVNIKEVNLGDEL